jgi:hypothetical protein
MSRTLFSRLFAPKSRHARSAKSARNQLAMRRSRPQVERMECRINPTVLDLSGSAGLSGFVGDILFTGVSATNFNTSTGTGVISPFLRVQKDGVERGYNTGAASPTIVDPTATVDNKGGSFSPYVQLSDLPTIVHNDVNGNPIFYYEFLLDAHQSNSKPLLSLDQIRFYLSSTKVDPNVYDQGLETLKAGTTSLTKVDDMDSTNNSYVIINTTFNAGSGRPDMFMDVPTSVFGADKTKFLYLYTRFGDHNAANATFEEWAHGAAPIQIKITPTTQINEVSPVVATNITTAPAGAVVQDTSTVTQPVGFPTPTGTVTYTFTGTQLSTIPVASVPASWSGAGTNTWTEVVPLNGNGTVPNSDLTAGLPAGSYVFHATYSGDINYGGDVSADEPLTITKTAAPPLTTTIFDSSGGAVTNKLGESVYDTASFGVIPPGVIVPQGTVTYTFTGAGLAGLTVPSSFTQVDSTHWTETVTIAMNGSIPNSDATGPLPAGTDYAFSAHYNGDSNYDPADSPSEPLTINKATLTINTLIHDASHNVVSEVPLGTVVHDTAQVTGIVAGFTPTGAITFTLDGSSIATDGADAGSGDTRSVDTAGLAAGAHSFTASIAGDSNYVGDTTDSPEALTVDKATLTINTLIHDAAHNVVSEVPLGTVVHDTAQVTGIVAGFTPTGAITFTFDGSSIATDGADAGSGDTRSVDTAGLAAGAHSFTASIAGDSNYVGDTTDSPEALTVDKATLTINTKIHDANHNVVTQVPAGSSVHDTAQVTGIVAGFTPTGAITFTFDGGAIATAGTDSSSGDTRSADTGALAAGTHSFTASIAGDSNYVGDTTDAPEVLTVTSTSQITPTGTTVLQFLNGTASTLTELDYKVKSGLINSVSPGVFFYYTQFTVTAANTVVLIHEVPSESNVIPISQAPATSQVTLYDSAGNKLTLPTATFSNSNGDVSITITAPGTYELGVKYSPSSLAGQAPPSPNSTETYTFQTELNGNVTTSAGGLSLIKVSGLHLAAPAATVAVADDLSQQALDAALNQGIAYWRAQGVNAQALAGLGQLNYSIMDLDDNALGYQYGTHIDISANAAGYGWSSGRVDLLTTVEHELGHALGFDHDNAGTAAGQYSVMAEFLPLKSLASSGSSSLATNFVISNNGNLASSTAIRSASSPLTRATDIAASFAAVRPEAVGLATAIVSVERISAAVQPAAQDAVFAAASPASSLLLYGTYGPRSSKAAAAFDYLFSSGDALLSEEEQVPPPAEIRDAGPIEPDAFQFEEMSAPRLDWSAIPARPLADQLVPASDVAQWDASLEVGSSGTAAAAMLLGGGYLMANRFPGREERLRRTRQRV